MPRSGGNVDERGGTGATRENGGRVGACRDYAETTTPVHDSPSLGPEAPHKVNTQRAKVWIGTVSETRW